MIKTDAVNAGFFHQVQNSGDIRIVVAVDGKAEAHPLAHGHTVLDALHGTAEGPLLTAKGIMNRLQAVQTDAHITHSHVF